MEIRSSRRLRTLVTQMALRGLSANEIARTLIPMMARSRRSNQRPDTLMQDRYRQIDELSCDAWPDHTYGSITSVDQCQWHFGFTLDSGHVAALPRTVEMGP